MKLLIDLGILTLLVPRCTQHWEILSLVKSEHNIHTNVLYIMKLLPISRTTDYQHVMERGVCAYGS